VTSPSSGAVSTPNIPDAAGQERHDARQAWPFAFGDGESGVQLGQRGGAAAAVDGVGDPKLDRTLQRHGFEVAESVAPQLCLGLQELFSTGARHAGMNIGIDGEKRTHPKEY